MGMVPPPTTEATTTDDNNTPTQTEARPQLANIPIPVAAKGIATGAYDRILLNRIKESTLKPYDTNEFPPIFIYDGLMLPGSLANLLGEEIPKYIMEGMTPALLPGYRAHVDQPTLQPRVVKSSAREAHVQGIVVFGLGQNDFDILDGQYQPDKVAKEMNVEIDVSTPVHSEEGIEWRLRRKVIKAYTWLPLESDNKTEEENQGQEEDDEPLNIPKIGEFWTLEDYIEGNLEVNETVVMRVEPSGKGDEVEAQVNRETTRGPKVDFSRGWIPSGSVVTDYARSDIFTGW